MTPLTSKHSGFYWKEPPEDTVIPALEEYLRAIHNGVLAIAQFWSPQIQNWMRENAPWTDRTGNARQTLHTEVIDVTGEMVGLMMAHGVTYGYNLELRNSGRYAIIGPALDKFAPLIWANVKELLGK